MKRPVILMLVLSLSACPSESKKTAEKTATPGAKTPIPKTPTPKTRTGKTPTPKKKRNRDTAKLNEVPTDGLASGQVANLVTQNGASFVFPVPDQPTWSWFTGDPNVMEYAWLVILEAKGRRHSFGYSLFRGPGKRSSTGTLAELLAAGQSNAWIRKGRSTSFDDAEIVRVRAVPDGVRVDLEPGPLLDAWLELKPEQAKVDSTQQKKKSTSDVVVQYR